MPSVQKMLPRKKNGVTKKSTTSKTRKPKSSDFLVDQLSSIIDTSRDEEMDDDDEDNEEEDDEKYEDAMDRVNSSTGSSSSVKNKQKTKTKDKATKPSRIPTLSPNKPPRQAPGMDSMIASVSSSSILPKSSILKQISLEINKLVQSKDPAKILALNEKLITESKSLLNTKYQSQLSKADLLVEKLMLENDSLRERIKLLEQDPTRSAQTSKTSNDDDSTVVFDILELLLNISCIEFSEDPEKIQFKLKQTSGDQKMEMIYKLVINKSQKIDEILYQPIFDESEFSTENIENPREMIKNLKSKLPDYFLDELSFPSSNLNNFYNKINRSLNKPI